MNTEQIRTIENVLNCKLVDKDNGVFKFVFKAHKDRYIEFYMQFELYAIYNSKKRKVGLNVQETKDILKVCESLGWE